jgi:hypothetical protein
MTPTSPTEDIVAYQTEDHLQILNVMHGYTFAVDRKDVPGIRNAFHPDARINAFANEFSLDDYCIGIPKIVEKMTTLHMITNEVVEVEGDRAAAQSYVYAYHRVPANLGNPAADAIFGAVNRETDSLILGRYEDTFEKRNGSWKISYKRIHLVWQQHLPTMPPFPGWAGM